MENFYLFILTALAAAVLPGADFALVTKNTLAAGKAGGQATALGIAAGLMIHTAAAVLGLSAIITRSALIFEIIKYIGAAYLCYLGTMTFITAGKSTIPQQPAEPGSSAGGFKGYFWQGVITNALNPKASVFYLTLLPQFVTPGKDSLLYLALLGFTAVIIVMSWFIFLAHTLNYLRRWFDRAAFRMNFQRCIGLMLVSFGLKLALAKR